MIKPYLPDGYSWTNSVFSQANFSWQDGYSNSGTRTNYIPSSLSGYPFSEGFMTKPDSSLYTDKSIEQISDPVFFTINAKLYRAEELDIKNCNKKSIFSTVTVNGLAYEADGFMSLQSIYKPSPNLTSRLSNGVDNQILVGEYFRSLNQNVTYTTNKLGSVKTDVVLNINNTIDLNVEVKSSKSGLKSIHTMFDKSVKRGKISSPYAEKIAAGYCKFFSIEKTTSYLEALIDFFRNDDDTIGFAGDLGVAKSGKLPRVLMTTEPEILEDLFITMIDHFQENLDHYFAIVDRSTNKVHAYFVGADEKDNFFKLPNLMKIVRGGLSTYGGACSGNTRVGFKVKFDDYE